MAKLPHGCLWTMVAGLLRRLAPGNPSRRLGCSYAVNQPPMPRKAPLEQQQADAREEEDW